MTRLPLPAWGVIAAVTLVLDQLSKWAAQAWLTYHEPVALLPVFNLTLSYNTGAAFSFLGSAGGWQRWLFTGFALAVSVVLVVWLRRIAATERWQIVGLALILGGAVGNAIDRLAYGHVVDFIHVHWGDWHYPIFNIADSAITVGVVLVLVHAFFLEGRPRPG
ncbi:MAG: signal peptidase II [Ectothiorhodospiraceae bacterium]